MNIWTEVAGEVEQCKAITWDTCHKIYIIMDDEQVALMEEYEYDPIVMADTTSPEGLIKTLQEWYDESCGLRFIDAVTTNTDDPNKGFKTLVPQFSEDGE